MAKLKLLKASFYKGYSMKMCEIMLLGFLQIFQNLIIYHLKHIDFFMIYTFVSFHGWLYNIYQ